MHDANASSWAKKLFQCSFFVVLYESVRKLKIKMNKLQQIIKLKRKKGRRRWKNFASRIDRLELLSCVYLSRRAVPTAHSLCLYIYCVFCRLVLTEFAQAWTDWVEVEARNQQEVIIAFILKVYDVQCADRLSFKFFKSSHFKIGPTHPSSLSLPLFSIFLGSENQEKDKKSLRSRWLINLALRSCSFVKSKK